MAKHTHLQFKSHTDISWTCDVCGKPIKTWKNSSPPRCDVSGKDLCKAHKYNITIQAGKGHDDISVSYTLSPDVYNQIMTTNHSLNDVVTTIERWKVNGGPDQG